MAAPAPRVDVKGYSLQWAVGGFLFLVGGAMLVAPHDYAAAWRVLVWPYPAWWGSLYLLAGLALMAVPTLVPSTWFSAAAYLVGAVLLLVLAAAELATGRLIGVAGNVPLAVACLLALYLDYALKRPEVSAGSRPSILLRTALGLSGALAGLVLVAAPAYSADAVFDPLRPLLPWSGLVLFFAGAALAALPLLPLQPPARAAWVKLASVAAGVLCLVYVIIAVLGAGNWPGIAYWGWLGLILAAEAMVGGRVRSALVPGSLRTRLAFLLAAAAAIPLIIVVTVVTERMESAGRVEALAREGAQAIALADSVGEYVHFHRAALDTLAAQPGLAAMSRADQVRELKIFHQAFPDVLAFTLYGPDGSPIAGSDGISGAESIAGSPSYEAARATGRPSMDVVASPSTKQPVFEFVAPIFDAQGRFAGLASATLESARVADFLSHESRGQGHVYLVNDKGQVLAQRDSGAAPPLSDLSATPPVAAGLKTLAQDGSLAYNSDASEQLTGYARVTGLRWIVVAEQSADQVLASVRTGREIVFAVLLLSLAATSLAGWWLAGRLARPLTSLAGASQALAAGNSDVPLPKTGIAEADFLAQTFGTMRAALAERSARLQASEAELRETANKLGRANQALQQSHVELQALSRRLLEVQEEERRVLSRDLHDTASQSLSALKMGLGHLERESDHSSALTEQITALQLIAETVLEDLHRLAVNLRPISLDRYGLVAAVRQLAASFERQSGVHPDLVLYGMNNSRLPGDVETTLYRIVQESLANVARHAQAGRVAIILRHEAERASAIVEDDGVGFDVEEALRKGRLGLLGMRERAEMLGGTLTIESQEGAGTIVQAELPLREATP